MHSHLETLGAADVERLIAPTLSGPLPKAIYERTARYVTLLYRWNSRMNLTAVRDPKVFVALHLAECFLSAQSISPDIRTVLDFGSGAGLPGIPIALACPHLAVTLAESQHKKAAFLREAIRVLELGNAKVSSARVEDLPRDVSFDMVALRAVDHMEEALRHAAPRIKEHGWCMVLGSAHDQERLERAMPGFGWLPALPIPDTVRRVVLRGKLGSKAG